jgi:copper transport protein
MKALIRTGLVGAVLLVWLLLTSTPAAAHAQLLTTNPASGQHLARPPAVVTLRFNEPVHPVRGGIRLLNSGGRAVSSAVSPATAPDEVRLPVPAGLPDGAYLVTWRVVSTDSHPVAGSFAFTVGVATAAAPPASVSTQNAGVSVGFWAVRTVGYAALAVVAGGLVFLLICWPAGVADPRARRLLGAGWLAGVLAAAAALPIEAVYVANRSLAGLFDPGLLRDTLTDNYGHFAASRLVLYALAGLLLRRLRTRPAGAVEGWTRAGAAVLVVGLCTTWAATGHAREGGGLGAAVAVVTDTTHLVAMSAWLGGLALMLGCVLVARRDAAAGAAEVMPRFSRLAMVAVLVLVATGTFQAWHILDGSLAGGSGYLQLLLYKVAAFGLVICLAAASRSAVRRRARPASRTIAARPSDRHRPALTAAHRSGAIGTIPRRGAEPATAGRTTAVATRRATKRELRHQHQGDREALRILRRSVLFELLIAVAVLGITAGLVSTSPSGHHGTAADAYHGPFSATLRMTDGNQVVVWLDPARPGQNEMVVDVRDGSGTARDVPEVRAQFSRPDIGAEPMQVALKRIGPGQFQATDVQLPVSGAWRLTVWVRTTDIDESSVSTTASLT